MMKRTPRAVMRRDDAVGVGPVIVIAEDREDAVARGEAGEQHLGHQRDVPRRR